MSKGGKVVGFYEQTADRILGRLGQGSEQSFPEWSRVRSGGGGEVVYAYPPTAGIPAAVWNASTKQLTVGLAICKLAIKGDAPNSIKEGTETVLVENQICSAVATSGKPITIAKNSTSGNWEIIVEDCTGTSLTRALRNPLL